MAAKSSLPLLLVAGVGAVVLSAKSKKKKKKPATSKTPDKTGIMASGSVDRVLPPKGIEIPTPYEWRIRKSNGDYIAEAGKKMPRSLKVEEWHEVGIADNLEDAKEMAFAYIDKQPGFEYASSAVASGSHAGFDYVVRSGEYEAPVTLPPDAPEMVFPMLSGYIGEYRLNGLTKWTVANKGQDQEDVRLLTMEAGALAAEALGGNTGVEYPAHMVEWMNVCEGEIAMIDAGDPIGTVPYCPSAKAGATVTSGASPGADRFWRIQKTNNAESPYVIQRTFGPDWKYVDSDTDLKAAIIKGYNSIL